MKLLLLITLILTTQAKHLRNQDATLFRMEPQEAKIERFVETPSECSICQNVVAVMQNNVQRDGSLYQESKLQIFKAMAHHACHGFRGESKTQRECDTIVEDGQMMMDHLYDEKPSTCEILGHCKRCRPCPPPAECIICESPDAHELGLMDMVHTSWQSLKEFWNKPVEISHLADDPFP